MRIISKDYLSGSSNKSSMRLAFLWIMAFASMMIICTVLYLVLLIFTTPTSIDWMGLTAFIGAITTLVATVVTGKVQQKRQEVKREINPKSDALS